MGNANGVQEERHVSFGNEEYGTPRTTRTVIPERSFETRETYDVSPQIRSRESTFSLGQRIQEKAQNQRTVETVNDIYEDRFVQRQSPVRMDIPNDRWNNRPNGTTTTRTVTRQDWNEYNDRQPDYIDEREDWRVKQRPYGQRSTFISTNRRTRPIEETWQQSPRYYPQGQRQTNFQMDNYPDNRASSRAFNTRDGDDPWYHYNPVINKRADWALVGRHVISRPISAKPLRTVDQDFRRLRDIDTFSDPTPFGGSGVRPTNNPRIPRTPRSIYTYQDHWVDDVNTGVRRPTLNTYYKTYSVNSYR